MPRGKRKRGAFDCTVWLPDGSRYRAWTDSDKSLNDAELLSQFDDTFGRIVENLRKRVAETPRQEPPE